MRNREARSKRVEHWEIYSWYDTERETGTKFKGMESTGFAWTVFEMSVYKED